MNITSAQYYKLGEVNDGIIAVIDGVSICIPLNLDNRHYAEIMRQVDAGTLTIADAE